MYRLVVTEKPSVAMSIAVAMGVKSRKDGYMEGGGLLISWCVGHLAELADAEIYDPKYAKWRREDLPILPESWRFTIGRDKRGQFDTLRDMTASTKRPCAGPRRIGWWASTPPACFPFSMAGR